MDRDRYRAAEAEWWAAAGAAPTERFVRLPRHGVSVRVLEAGDGPPVLFLHGGPNAGSTWASLVARLTGFRCLVVDRPGTGLSDPFPIRRATARAHFETLAVDVLDALDIERADLVGSSAGSDFALLAGARHPDRVGRTVHFGCPGFTPGMRISLAWRVFSMPLLWRVAAASPVNGKGIRGTMGQLGHGASLAAGRIPEAFVNWSVALGQDTRTMHHEMHASAAIVTLRGIAPELVLTAQDLAAVASPTLFAWGDRDVFGGPELGRRMAAQMPDASVEVLSGAGHLAWLDDIDLAADLVRRHLEPVTPASAGIA